MVDVMLESTWIVGPACSGKTARLTQYFAQLQTKATLFGPVFLVFASNSENRVILAERLTTATLGNAAFRTVTPLGFVQDEVILFWPLLIERLSLKAQFPLALRPETEQEFAAQLWHPVLEQGLLRWPGVAGERLIRRILDLHQLTVLSAEPTSAITALLQQGFPEVEPQLVEQVGLALQQWRQWCLSQGFLTYSLVLELYQHHLLQHPLYQQKLRQQFCGVLADDVDEYPAVMRSVFQFFLDQKLPAVFTFNPNGAVRLGMGADPDYLRELATLCRVENVIPCSLPGLMDEVGELAIATLSDPLAISNLPDTIQSIQTTSRSQLLRQVASTIIDAVRAGYVEPQDIAVIGPGLDAISRYTLREILNRAGIAVAALNEQRPLINLPLIRALLTLLTLVYPGLGRLVNRNHVAEMLVVLASEIDLVRAGLIIDHCFEPHPETPCLLPITAFPRWDRLGYQASQAYNALKQWVETQRIQYQEHLIPDPMVLLDRAIQQFVWSKTSLPYDQVSALRELLETVQHYWDAEARLNSLKATAPEPQTTLTRFIQLLRMGTVTANPYPVRPRGPQRQTVSIATVFQYRSSRSVHRWHFWLDAGSPRWLTGIDALFGAGIFLQQRLGQPWTADDAMQANEQRLHRILQDLLSRAQERVFLCHSDLATNGQEQVGPLLSLINASIPITALDQVATN
jgi:hypothetical protein